MIVQELNAIQKAHGFLPVSELVALSQRIATPLYRLQEVSSFFPHFRREPPPRVEVKICRDMSCRLRGSCELRAELARACEHLGEQNVSVDGVSCLGRCDRAPALTINEHVFVQRSAGELGDIVDATLRGSTPPHDSDSAVPFDRKWKIDVYQGSPDYRAVRTLLAYDDPRQLIKELEVADLRGMGGAGAWAHQKWLDVLTAQGDEKYVVCNADESEPGTFKDREILLHAPHLVVEGVILAGLLVQAKRGYIYIRHEYEEQIAAVQRAIREAEAIGACGSEIFGTARKFQVEVFVSPGGYICGEQTALIEAMEDRRAEPRNRPPQLETNGYLDKPTLLSNVETFAWVPSIVLNGGHWYRQQGRPDCKGLRIFSLSGDVERPGVYEVPNGITLRELIERAGGMRDGRPLKAFAPSGPSGGFLPKQIPIESLAPGYEKRLPERLVREKLSPGTKFVDVLDLELDLQLFRDMGLMLGAGLVVYADDADLVDQAVGCLEFFRNESCGKCVPCRIGSQKLVEMGTTIQNSNYDRDQLAITEDITGELARTLEITSICGLGMVAANPLASLLRYFHEDIQLSCAARRANGEPAANTQLRDGQRD